MKITTHMAVSIDGFVARKDLNVDWVSELDLTLYEERGKERGCVIMGKSTFEKDGTMDDVLTIVLTHDPAAQTKQDKVTFVATPEEAIQAAETNGFDRVLLVGGGTTNGAFMSAGLIDEIYLTVHPIVLGEGVPLFGANKSEVNYKLLDTRKISDELVELHYAKK